MELDEGFTHQEATLAADVAREGRALLIAANKLDTLTPQEARRAIELVEDAALDALADVRGVPIVGMSAFTGRGAEALLPIALDIHSTWNQRISTSRLNKWIEGLIQSRPVGGGSELRRVKYLSQVKARPPTFVVFVSGSAALPDATKRFLMNQIREEFGFGGVPVRVTVRRKEKRETKKRGRR